METMFFWLSIKVFLCFHSKFSVVFRPTIHMSVKAAPFVVRTRSSKRLVSHRTSAAIIWQMVSRIIDQKSAERPPPADPASDRQKKVILEARIRWKRSDHADANRIYLKCKCIYVVWYIMLYYHILYWMYSTGPFKGVFNIWGNGSMGQWINNHKHDKHNFLSSKSSSWGSMITSTISWVSRILGMIWPH